MTEVNHLYNGLSTQSVGVPDVEVVPGETEVSVFVCCGAAFERHPSEGVVASVAV